MASKPIINDLFPRASHSFADLFHDAPTEPKWNLFRSRLSHDDFASHGLTVSKSKMFGVIEEDGGNVDRLMRSYDLIRDDLQVEHVSSAPWLAGVEERLNTLRQFALDEGAAFSELSAAASRSYLSRMPHVVRPGLFLLGNGNVRLLWATAEGEQIGLQFREEGDVQFILFQRHKGKLRETLGINSVEMAVRIINAMGLAHVQRE